MQSFAHTLIYKSKAYSELYHNAIIKLSEVNLEVYPDVLIKKLKAVVK